MIKKYHAYMLIGILVLAAGLRVSFLSRGDTATDEVLYAFRAIEMIDFDEAIDQPTPLEWFDPTIPWWTRISFHDHPPLVFWAQHISMNIFGQTRFGFRLPSALFGVLAVYMVYRIGLLLYEKEAGLFAALALAVTTNHLYISRIGLQESQLIFFLLAALYCALRAFSNRHMWLWFGVAFGCAIMTKYIAFVLLPIVGILMLVHDRSALRSRQLWLGVVIALVLFSPVIIYNWQLYRAVGHFDFQFSYIFGQDPEVWKVAPGKQIGTLGERVYAFPERLLATHSLAFLTAFLMAIGAFGVMLYKRMRETFRTHVVLFVSFLWLLALLAAIGPSYRFLTLLGPFMALAVGAAFVEWRVRARTAVFALLILFEAAYAYNTLIAYYSWGTPQAAYARGARGELYNWGYNELSDYLTKELQGKMPVASFDVKYKFLDNLQIKAAKRYQKGDFEPYYAVIVYDGNVQNMAQIWALDRLNMYHAWPVVKFEHYAEYMKTNAISDMTKAGFEEYYFIVATDALPLKRPENRTQLAQAFERELSARGIVPTRIINKRNEEVFRVYKVQGK